jgi:hypothetical protein
LASSDQLGTPHSGYLGADYAPFACHACLHFSWPHLCEHPDVIEDAKRGLGGLKLQKSGRAVVQAGGCCNYFRPKPK